MRSAAIFFAAALSVATSTGPVIEANGWTPVRSSQVASLPPEYLERRQQEEQERLRRLEEQRKLEEYRLEELEAQLRLEQQNQNSQEEVEDKVVQEVPQETLREEEEAKTTAKAENEISVDKAPLIVYPENSIRQSSPRQEDISVQTGAVVPEYTRPFFNQPPPQRPPPATGFQRIPRPPPRFNPKIRSPPPSKRPPPPYPQQALPRSDNIDTQFLTESRQFQQAQLQNRAQQPSQQLQPQPPQSAQPPQTPQRLPLLPSPGQRPPLPARPLPPRGGRPRLRPRPRPGGSGTGFFGGIGNKVKCAAKNALSDIRLNDDQYIQAQLKCVLDKGECDQVGIQIKRFAPEALRGICPPPCDECTNKQMQKIMAHISREYPQEWRELWQHLGQRKGN